MSAMKVTEILDVLTARRAHCREMLELSRRQRQLIDADDYAGLLDVLGRKQRVLGCLDELGKQHPQLKQIWHGQRDVVEPELREECEHILAETETLFSELLQEEKESTTHLTQRRDATREQLQAVSSGPQVHAAYRDSLAPSTHRHLDVGQ